MNKALLISAIAIATLCPLAGGAEIKWHKDRDIPLDLMLMSTGVADLTLNTKAGPIIKIDAAGNVFWRGRKVESDDEFKNAMLDLKAQFQHYNGFCAEQHP